MRKLVILLFTAIMVVIISCSQKELDNLVLVKGGTFINTKSNYLWKKYNNPQLLYRQI